MKKQVNNANGTGEIEIRRARDYEPQKPRKVKDTNRSDEDDPKRNDKLVNIVFNEGQYYLYDPRNVEINS